MFAWGLLGVIWIIRLIVASWASRPVPTTIRWFLIPLIFAVVVLAIRADVPFRVRFGLSQSSLEHGLAR
ncbi:hypothetical protein ACFHYQ_23940 [Sphaerimonospora cavernae]|uniref:Uncharacterized protein n=1 Tax=Sphaerimonospora cavernae TaxID=1740611 RepID=A0ABV6UB04_9ACTN